MGQQPMGQPQGGFWRGQQQGIVNNMAISPNAYTAPMAFRSLHKGPSDFAKEHDVFTHEQLAKHPEPGQRFESLEGSPSGSGLAANSFWLKGAERKSS